MPDPTTDLHDAVLATVNAFNDAWNAHDLEAALALVSDDCVFESARGGRLVGREALREAWAPGFANATAVFHFEEIFVAGDRVTQRWRFGDGDRAVRGVDVLGVRDGRIVEKLGYVKAG